ncbi:MAG TPA: hypothetical protein VN622_16885 [Clostridia bacterium]|nr:hypothetical protein [Clostridia bacterium]
MRTMTCLRILCGLAAVAGTAFATTVIPLSIEKLTTESAAVVEARAIDARSAWNAEHTRIYTYTRFQVGRVLKGKASQTITVKQIGGSAGGYTQKVAGVRHWNPGDEAVLFLHPSAEKDGTLAVTGLMQGNFSMRHLPSGEVVVSNGAPDVSAFQTEKRSVDAYRGAHLSLRELESRVEKAEGR